MIGTALSGCSKYPCLLKFGTEFLGHLFVYHVSLTSKNFESICQKPKELLQILLSNGAYFEENVSHSPENIIYNISNIMFNYISHLCVSIFQDQNFG